MVLAPALAALLALAVISAAILTLGLYKYTVGAMVQVLIATLSIATITVFGHGFNVFRPIIKLLEEFDNKAYAALGTLIDADKAVWAHLVHWTAYCWQETTGAINDVAHDTGQALHALRQNTIPYLIGASLKPIQQSLAYVLSKLNALEHDATATITHVTKVVESKVTEVKPVTVERITKVIAAKAVALPQAIANPWPRIRDVESELDKAWKDVKRLGKTLTPAGILGLVGAAVIGQMGLGWTRCKGVGRVGRGLCGISGLIESLFLDAVDALALANLCYLVEAMTAAAATISPVITEYGDELNTLLRCRGIHPGPGLAANLTAVPVPWANLSFGASSP